MKEAESFVRVAAAYGGAQATAAANARTREIEAMFRREAQEAYDSGLYVASDTFNSMARRIREEYPEAFDHPEAFGEAGK
jgi:transposase